MSDALLRNAEGPRVARSRCPPSDWGRLPPGGSPVWPPTRPGSAHARGVARIVDGENSQGRRETRERLATTRITMQCRSGPFQLIMQPRFDDLSQRNEGIIAPKRAESF